MSGKLFKKLLYWSVSRQQVHPIHVSSPLSEIRPAWLHYLKCPLRWPVRNVSHSPHHPPLRSLHRSQGSTVAKNASHPSHQRPEGHNVWVWPGPRGCTELPKAPKQVSTQVHQNWGHSHRWAKKGNEAPGGPAQARETPTSWKRSLTPLPPGRKERVPGQRNRCRNSPKAFCPPRTRDEPWFLVCLMEHPFILAWLLGKDKHWEILKIKFTLLNCTIRWCSVYSQSWATITTNYEHLHNP